MTVRLSHQDADIDIEELSGDRRRVTVTPAHERVYIATRRYDTRYPLPLIEQVLAIKGPAFLLDEIRREEDPAYVARRLLTMLTHYEPETHFMSARICDFGCGSGASTMILARRFPKARLTGVDISEKLLGLARARRAFYGFNHVDFLRSPDGCAVPPDLGRFDVVIMSGVYEHLLPNERIELMPQIWDLLVPGGLLVIDDTPYRYAPLESHTTGLPLINYLPDDWAHRAAQTFSRRVRKGEPWPALLRSGIRGATPGGIARSLMAGGGPAPELLEPQAGGLHDRVDLWYAISAGQRLAALKWPLKLGLKTLNTLTGICLVPTLDLAFRKPLGERH